MRCVSSERGFTLMELMIASAIMLVVLAGAMTAFEEARRIVDNSTRIVDAGQNLRASANLIVRDLLQTGRNIPTSGIPVPTGSGIAVIKRPGPLTAAGTAQTLAAGTTSIAGVIPGAALGPLLNGVTTDAVSVLYDDPTLALNAWPLTSVAADGSSAVVDTRTSITTIGAAVAAGDLIMFNNAVGYAVQQVTRVSGQTMYFETTGDSFGFNQRTATAGSIMQIKSGASFPPTSATRILMITYYLDAVTVPAQPRLVRATNFRTAQIVAGNIDNLQLSYDVVDGVTNPVNQKTPVSPNTPQQIRGVNLFLMARGTPVQRPTGQTVRSGMATQVTLRSMSFVARYR